MQCSLCRGPTTYQAAFPPPSDSALSMTADESTTGLVLFSGSGPPGASPQDRTTKCPHREPCPAVPPAPEHPWFLLAEHPFSADRNTTSPHTPFPCSLRSRRA